MSKTRSLEDKTFSSQNNSSLLGAQVFYHVQQKPDEVQITFQVPEKLKRKDFDIQINRNTLFAAMKDQASIIEGTLFSAIVKEHSYWRIEGNSVLICLEKENQSEWPILIVAPLPHNNHLDAQSEYNLGVANENGNAGFVQDMKKALEHYQRAANEGFPDAQIKIAHLLQEESWINQMENYHQMNKEERNKTILKYLRMAADPDQRDNQKENQNDMNKQRLNLSGKIEAQYELGRAYYEGKYGLSSNSQSAKYWLKFAADQGHSNAAYLYGSLLYNNGDKESAFRYWNKAASFGSLEACMKLGNAYLIGETPMKADALLAKKYFDQAQKLDPSKKAPEELIPAVLAAEERVQQDMKQKKRTVLKELKQLRKPTDDLSSVFPVSVSESEIDDFHPSLRTQVSSGLSKIFDSPLFWLSLPLAAGLVASGYYYLYGNEPTNNHIGRVEIIPSKIQAHASPNYTPKASGPAF